MKHICLNYYSVGSEVEGGSKPRNFLFLGRAFGRSEEGETDCAPIGLPPDMLSTRVRHRVPLIIFDLQTNLSDVCWSPFSSTVFSVLAAVECRAVFYDLDVSVKEPVCEQLIHPASNYRLTRVAFDRRAPIVVIGSSR